MSAGAEAKAAHAVIDEWIRWKAFKINHRWRHFISAPPCGSLSKLFIVSARRHGRCHPARVARGLVVGRDAAHLLRYGVLLFDSNLLRSDLHRIRTAAVVDSMVVAAD